MSAPANTSAAGSNAALKRRFEHCATQWLRETVNISDLAEMAWHPAYREIIALGTPALPFIFERLKQAPDYWFEALAEITGQEPVKKEDWGKPEAMRTAWLGWARTHGYS